jgi:hypothetical protein
MGKISLITGEIEEKIDKVNLFLFKNFANGFIYIIKFCY